MTERQKKLVNDYGPRFYSRSRKIENEFLHLTADAVSVLTDEEFESLGAAIDTVIMELKKAQEIVKLRLKEAGAPVR